MIAKRMIIGFTASLMLAACGQKGPLYFPDSEPKKLPHEQITTEVKKEESTTNEEPSLPQSK